MDGTGHSEGEGCEHIFSSSNDLACSAHHATHFHQHQMIEEHFNFWNEDKYANLSKFQPLISCSFLNLQFKGKFYLNHYQAALDDIETLEAELSAIQEELPLTSEDFK